MRRWLPLLGALASCHPRSNAQWYTRALSDETSFEDARSDCRHVSEPTARDDCLLAVLEQYHRLAETDCAELQVMKWREECLFQLAERQNASGDLALGLATCNRSRYARPCSWHLVQDEVEASLGDAPSVAEPRIDKFKGVRSLPDAPLQFWLIRFREQSAAGKPIDEADCDGLRDPIACRNAVQEHIQQVLDTMSGKALQTVCRAAPGERVKTAGKPAWAMGPIATATDARWAGEHCR